MKRFFIFTIFVLASTFTISSCTEESVEPKSESDNGGGAANDPIVRG